jgi:hypothetical protein
MILLVDLGSSHTFVSKAFAARANYTLSRAKPVTVKVVNDQLMHSKAPVLGLQWTYEGHTFSDNNRLLDIGAYDAILGMDWLDRCSPMYCHWARKVLRVTYQGEMVTLQGMVSPVQTQLQEVTVAQ